MASLDHWITADCEGWEYTVNNGCVLGMLSPWLCITRTFTSGFAALGALRAQL